MVGAQHQAAAQGQRHLLAHAVLREAGQTGQLLALRGALGPVLVDPGRPAGPGTPGRDLRPRRVLTLDHAPDPAATRPHAAGRRSAQLPRGPHARRAGCGAACADARGGARFVANGPRYEAQPPLTTRGRRRRQPRGHRGGRRRGRTEPARVRRKWASHQAQPPPRCVTRGDPPGMPLRPPQPPPRPGRRRARKSHEIVANGLLPGPIANSRNQS